MDKITTQKIKKFFKGKGFAGALCLSVVAIGISTYLTYDSTLKTIADEEPKKPESSVSQSRSITRRAEYLRMKPQRVTTTVTLHLQITLSEAPQSV